VSVDPTTGHIIKLRFIGPEFDDSFMERVGTLSGLEHLTLQGTSVTKTGLKRLTSLSSLKFLTITGPPQFSIDDLGATAAALPNLRYVEIGNWAAAKAQSERVAAATPKVKWVWSPLPQPLIP
jgi:hypothetical protein